jgi:cytoskeletal protein RodZ
MSFWNWVTRKRTDHGWPGYIINGRIRTSTAGLIVAFFVIAWLHNAYQPPAPTPATPETAQVVPPGFMPDPEYTWVPRTNVETRPRTTMSTTTPTTTTTETTPTESTPETTSATDTTSEPTTSGPEPTTVVDPDGPGPLPPTTLTDTPTATPLLPVPNRSGTSTATVTTVFPGIGPVPPITLPPG